MEERQDHKRKQNFFKQSDAPRIVGLGLLLVGFILLFCSGYLDVKYVLVIFAWIAMPVGLVLFIVAGSVRTNEEDMDKHMEDQLLGLVISAAEEDKYRKRLLPQKHPRVLEGYEYREGLMLRRDKVNTLRSSEFSRTLLYLLRDGFFLVTRTISLLDSEQREQRVEIRLEDICEVAIVEEQKHLTFENRQFDAKDVRLLFRYRDGSTYSVPVHRDMDLEDFVELCREWLAAGEISL